MYLRPDGTPDQRSALKFSPRFPCQTKAWEVIGCPFCTSSTGKRTALSVSFSLQLPDVQAEYHAFDSSDVMDFFPFSSFPPLV